MNIPYVTLALTAAIIYLIVRVSLIARDNNRLRSAVASVDSMLDRLDGSCESIQSSLKSLSQRLSDAVKPPARPEARVSPDRKPKRKKPARTRH